MRQPTSLDRSEFESLVLGQIELLRAGKPLEAFDKFYDNDVVMFDNDKVFATDKKTARELQAGFMNSARAIQGEVSKYAIFPDAAISVLHNTTRFVDADGKKHKINGIHWQSWRDGLIIEERYFRDNVVEQLTEEGIFDRPNRPELAKLYG
jgi:hypothetical protein